MFNKDLLLVEQKPEQEQGFAEQKVEFAEQTIIEQKVIQQIQDLLNNLVQHFLYRGGGNRQATMVSLTTASANHLTT